MRCGCVALLPNLQSDPHGVYIRCWVPELSALPDEWIHEPWSAPSEVLRGAGITLGQHYPLPIVDHAVARERALSALAATRAASPGKASADD